MAESIERVLELIEARIAELEQTGELPKLYSARAALTGEPDPRQTLEEQRDALKDALNAMRKERDDERARVQRETELRAEQSRKIDRLTQQVESLKEELAKHEAAKVPPKPTPAEERKKAVEAERTKRQGAVPTEQEKPTTADVRDCLVDGFERGEWFMLADAVTVVQVKYPDANPHKIKDRMVALREEKIIQHNGVGGRGSKWQVPAVNPH